MPRLHFFFPESRAFRNYGADFALGALSGYPGTPHFHVKQQSHLLSESADMIIPSAGKGAPTSPSSKLKENLGESTKGNIPFSKSEIGKESPLSLSSLQNDIQTEVLKNTVASSITKKIKDSTLENIH
jgi:hypothetical protein